MHVASVTLIGHSIVKEFLKHLQKIRLHQLPARLKKSHVKTSYKWWLIIAALNLTIPSSKGHFIANLLYPVSYTVLEDSYYFNFY